MPVPPPRRRPRERAGRDGRRTRETARGATGDSASAPEARAVQQEILVGIYILDIGKLDISTGSFTVDFYLDLKSKNPKDPIPEEAPRSSS